MLYSLLLSHAVAVAFAVAVAVAVAGCTARALTLVLWCVLVDAERPCIRNRARGSIKNVSPIVSRRIKLAGGLAPASLLLSLQYLHVQIPHPAWCGAPRHRRTLSDSRSASPIRSQHGAPGGRRPQKPPSAESLLTSVDPLTSV